MAQFQAYSAIIIGDPSTTSCSANAPSDAVNTDATWGPAVTGNVVVLGTAPALAGATTPIEGAIAYAASGSGTGLYVSLNCEKAGSAAGTAVRMLSHVDDSGHVDANFTVTGQNPNATCPASAGTVNTWQALADTQFNGLAAANLGPWTGQAYILAGPATAAASTTAYSGTTALAPSTGGQVPAGTTVAGQNPAAPGVDQATSNGVNTATGDFSQSNTDLSVATYGPSLGLSRTYDAQAAQQQSQTGKPGPMGDGWTDNWASSVSAASPTPGDIYTIDGLRTNTGDGGPPTGVLGAPATVVQNGSDIYIVDLADNRIEEIPGKSKTQWGRSMTTAGDMYTVVG